MKFTLSHKAFPPKRMKQIKAERIKIIEDYLEGNLLRFLRKHYKNSVYQYVYSETFSKWKKEGHKQVVRIILKNYVWPKHVCNIVNVMTTLNKYYGLPININTVKVAIVILDLFEMDIDKYGQQRRGRLFKMDMYQVDNSEKARKKALKEQKARGFVHINEFEDWDPYYAHIFSLVDMDYVYPMNFPFSHFNEEYKDLPYAYVAHTLVGVNGFTRLKEPQNKVVLYKRIKN